MSAKGHWDKCLTCGVGIWLTAEQYEHLKQSCQSFFCIWGHSQHFVQGPSEAQKLRQERDRLKQEAARLEEVAARERRWRGEAEDARAAAERRASAARGQVTKLKKRAAAGVCPCCNRTFQDLARHMAGQHPGFTAEEVAPEGATLQ